MDQEEQMSLSEQQMSDLIALIGQASSEQLLRANQQIRTMLDVRARQAANSIKEGARVQWKGKLGHQIGIVEKVKQKYVEVKVTDGPQIGMRWNVTASMLSPAPEKKP
jgi:hypothetical protein